MQSELHCLPGQGQGVRACQPIISVSKMVILLPGAAFEVVKESPALALIDAHTD